MLDNKYSVNITRTANPSSL